MTACFILLHNRVLMANLVGKIAIGNVVYFRLFERDHEATIADIRDGLIVLTKHSFKD